METIYVKFNYPEDNSVKDMSDNDLNHCFIIGHYPDYATALYVYAETPCSWSTILDEGKDYHEFVEEAKKHIRENDYDWLEEHFT